MHGGQYCTKQILLARPNQWKVGSRIHDIQLVNGIQNQPIYKSVYETYAEWRAHCRTQNGRHEKIEYLIRFTSHL